MANITLETHIDQVAAGLEREATAAKNAKDWDHAIACLRKVNARRGEPSSIRLALYLQQAGRFDAAMAEFARLVDTTPATVAKQFAHTTATTRRAIVATQLMLIYDKAALACRRERRPADAARYADLAAQQQAIRAELQPIGRAEEKQIREKKRKDWEKKWL